MEKPELDYAFLADYAQVQNDKLTVVGASFTQMFTPSFPADLNFFIAGRIRVPEQEHFFELDLRVQMPNVAGEDPFTITMNGHNMADPNAHRYDGKYGMLFTAGISAPAFTEGLVEVLVDINGEQVRRLAFDICRIRP